MIFLYFVRYSPKRMRNLFIITTLLLSVQLKAQPRNPYDSVQTVLEKVMRTDQSIRLYFDSLQKKPNTKQAQLTSLIDSMNRIDAFNLIQVRQSLDTYGWLSIDDIGERANLAQFLVIQHADSLTQLTYLPMMRQAVKNGKAQASQLALLEDRILVRQGKPQLYGSQLHSNEKGKYVFYPIQDEANVNQRRATMGLGTLEQYARNFGIEYHQPKPQGN